MRPKPLCKPDDPFVGHYRIGGKPWAKDGVLRRIYFSSSPGLRGQSAWERDNPGRLFPSGYYDVLGGNWVVRHSGWTHADYAQLMEGAIKRQTAAPFLPEKDVFTRDGVRMVPGMIVMFHGGQIPGRPHWGTNQLHNRLMIAGNRDSAWYFGEEGKVTSYGSMGVPVREYADHAFPYRWLVYPLSPEDPFVIEGHNVDVTWSFLYVAPPISLVSVDGGRRFADSIPATPTPAELRKLEVSG